MVAERDCGRGAESFSEGAMKRGRLWTVTGAILSVVKEGCSTVGWLAVVAGLLAVLVAWFVVVV